ncbi:hypothetical protein [Streptomyces sp. Tue6028]|uniref:hypothetical protein n=1 Tax=Streptomyces sp. Tue6028 TaxID=2036037 RepID=UPI003EB7D0D0
MTRVGVHRPGFGSDLGLWWWNAISVYQAAVVTGPLRHHHHLGLLPEPVRRSNGYRDHGIRDAVLLAGPPGNAPNLLARPASSM